MIEFTLGDDIIIYKGRISKRRCFRVYHPKLFVKINFFNEETHLFHVKNISSYGIAFYPFNKKELFSLNQQLLCSIIFESEVVVKDIKAKVVRITSDAVCCEFFDLSRREEYKLDELVLKIQKDQIKLKKQKEK